MNTINNALISFIISLVLFFSTAVSAVSWFGDDEEIIWEGAVNNYFKYAELDDSAFGKNDHPFKVDEEELINALSALAYTETGLLGGETVVPVFSYSQIRILAEYLSKGLSEAKPNQDIIYAIGGSSKKVIILTRKSYTTGSVFYKDNKLNILIGEYNFLRSQAMEKELDPSGRGDINYSFSHGKRTKKSNKFKNSLLGIAGISQKAINGKLRQDWIEIDVKVAAEAYLASKEAEEDSGASNARILKIEAAKLAKQRREMRSEMARLRRDMNKKDKAVSSTRNIEDRITTLDELLAKELISKEEYAAKRKEILNDI
ncbi:MAG: SHOCT domain-containing protein [Rhodospirillaceae bacterium]|jgi:hypothetical protein|nr:SHOCT domain-containing protein [Rhodospirillaceae bacterium]